MNKNFLCLVLGVVLICGIAGVFTMTLFNNKGTINVIDYDITTNLEPGKVIQLEDPKTLEKMGAHPFEIEDIVQLDNNYAQKLEGELDIIDTLILRVLLENEIVFENRVKELKKSGQDGLFCFPFVINSQKEPNMIIEVQMEETAGNEYQSRGFAIVAPPVEK
ncbi:hypothetical protein PRVXH_001765 [Proteinivorax hydrogeniformans]|uniref:SAF domain-containing protein n=1 Tax=Proteinivorax hydrogeniformans TaxID=1826727 RepID=A0AAU8HQX2_9FIRM